MRSATSIQISRAWWKKEAPDGLGAAGDGFADAVAAYAKANSAMRRPDQRALEAFAEAIAAVESAGEDVADTAKSLLKEAKGDRERERDLKNTVAVMGRPLKRELDQAREGLEEAEADLEGDGSDDQIVDAASHARYIRDLSAKLKRRSYNFALAMQSTAPEDMRFVFHRKRGARSLTGRLKRALKVKKVTFGVAGAQALAEEVAGEDVSKRTLVLYVEGRKIPSLAKRVRAMLKRLGVSTFSRVKVYEKGQEVESADESSDERFEPVSLEDGDDGAPPPELPRDRGPGRAHRPEPARHEAMRATNLASEAAAGLRRRLVRLHRLAEHLPKGETRTFREVADIAKRRIDDGAIGAAERTIKELERRFEERPKRAPKLRSESPTARLDRLAEALKKMSLDARRVMANQPDSRPAVMRGLTRAKALINAKSAEEAQEEIFATGALLKSLRAAEGD